MPLKTLLATLLLCLSTTIHAQELSHITNKKGSNIHFTPIKEIATTSVKSQDQSGTCWSFATQSFLESEILRTNNTEVDLSEMFIVRKCYEMKADKYIRMFGKTNFSAGGEPHDVMMVIKNYGLMPQNAYPTLQDNIDHTELDNVTSGFVNALIKSTDKISKKWKVAFNALLDSYLGTEVQSFQYNNKTYTPLTFANDMNINPDNYIEITSFTHHPFYTTFIMEVPDNWAWGKVYNVPLADLTAITDHAITNNYSLAWASDVSEKGFQFKNGIAILPELELENTTIAQRDSLFNNPVAEKQITQEMRQDGFDTYATQDDHGMHINGLFKDQTGKEYYRVKNSWGTKNDSKGYFYCSKAYFQYKTTCIMVHKNALPADIKRKLGL